MVEFTYPIIAIIKGCNEVIIYSLTEDLFYYLKLNAPVIMASSSTCSKYSPRLDFFIDLGHYITYSKLNLTLGASPYITQDMNVRYLDKALFPPQKLLAGFDYVKVKFLAKEEDAFTLQFENTIINFGAMTYGLTQTIESNYKLGEIISAQYDSFYVWKKHEKSIKYFPTPANLADA